MKKKYLIKGMSCAACQNHVESAVRSINGINKASVNLIKNEMVVLYDENITNDAVIISAVKNAGYGCIVINDKDNKNVKDNIEIKSKILVLIISFVLLLILMYISMGNIMFGWKVFSFLDYHSHPIINILVQAIISVIALVLNYHYFTNGFKFLFKGKPNMDSLIALGSSISFFYGVYLLIKLLNLNSLINKGILEIDNYNMFVHEIGHSLYFESCVMILVFVSLGKLLEGVSKQKSTNAINDLIALLPKDATKLENGKEINVPASELQVGDIVIVKKGDIIPIDGKVVDGKGTTDESSFTGESMPVTKNINDICYSSTILLSGYLIIKTEKLQKDCKLAVIIEKAFDASESKPEIARIADKVSSIFVPIIILISILTFLINLIISQSFSLSLSFAITVLVIACPCSLGLATPVAIMCGMGVSAKNGLLIKDAKTLEKICKIKTIVFDKTGTITKGRPEVVNFDFYIHENNDEYLSILNSIELKSEHPLAKAIVEYCKFNNTKVLPIDSFEQMDGMGIKGVYEDNEYYICSYLSLKDLVFIDDKLEQKYKDYANEGKTVLLFTKDQDIIALIAIRDQIKEHAKDAIKELEKQKINLVMISGDNAITTSKIAEECGIKEFYGETLPNEKLEILNSIRPKDGLTAMCGDGVNDSIALSNADIGIGFNHGADISKESSDVILLNDDLMEIVNLISLSKLVMRKIKENLFWAFFYNLICVILATGFLYYINGFKINSMYGSVAMSISSLTVVTNALFIFKFKPQKINTKGESCLINSLSSNNDSNEKFVYTVLNMHCEHCSNKVKNICLSQENIVNAVVLLKENKVILETTEKIDLEKLKNDLEKEGYTLVC